MDISDILSCSNDIGWGWVMLDLASNNTGECIKVKDIAAGQEISWKDIYDAVNKVIDGVTLADLLERRQKRMQNLDYSI